MSYRGKHRKMSAATRTIARVAVAGIAVGTPLAIAATPAQASGINWEAIAQCESGGNWSTATGNGYYGGLQFSPSTWKSYGGQGSANGASRDQQIAVAERVLQSQGIGAWPTCGRHGVSSDVVDAANTHGVVKKAPKAAAPSPVDVAPQAPAAAAAAAAGAASSNPAGDYTVLVGDTLSGLASEFQVPGGYQQLQKLNEPYIPNADIILVGQKIATK